MKIRKGSAPQTQYEVLQAEIDALRRQISKIVQTGPSSIQPDDWEEAVTPAPFEVMIHGPGYHPEATPHDNVVYYHPGYVDPVTEEEVLEGWKSINDHRMKNIKIYGDRRVNRVDTTYGFRFPIEFDLHKTKISWILGFNGIAGTGTTTLTINNFTRGITPATVTIPSGARLSNPVVIDEGGDPAEPNHMVFENDWFHLFPTAVGAGSRGLGVYIKFS